MANPRKRVYWKRLTQVLHIAENYIGRYDSQLADNLTDEQFEAVQALQAQIVTVINLLPENTPV